MTPAYRYRATLVRVVDGDTYWLSLDLGFRTFVHLPIRLRGLDTPELSTPEGYAAKHAAENILQSAREIVVESFKNSQTFARWVADVWVDGRLLADVLRETGHVKTVASGPDPA